MKRRVFRQTTRRLGASLTVRLGTPIPGAIGHYDRRAREIVISPALSHAGRIVVLVHELLHAVDEQIVASGETRYELPHEWITAAARRELAELRAKCPAPPPSVTGTPP